MATLRLHVKACYFDEIDAGTKPDEFRLCSPYWTKRLVGKVFDGIEVLKGYPKAGDLSRIFASLVNMYDATVKYGHD